MRALVTVGALSIAIALVMSTDVPVPLFQVTSSSMEPTLGAGELVVVVPPVLSGGVAEGDIVTFRGPHGWTAHRVIDRTDTVAITAGDANPFTDQQAGATPIPIDKIAGVVPTIRGQALAISVPIDRSLQTVGTLVGGVMMAIGLRGRLDIHRGSVRPWMIGLLAAVVAILGWLLGGATVAIDGRTVAHAGPVPTVVINETAAEVAVLGPGESIERLSDSLTVVPGWAPQWMLEMIVHIDGRLAVVVVALTTGVLLGGAARLLWIWVPDR